MTDIMHDTDPCAGPRSETFTVLKNEEVGYARDYTRDEVVDRLVEHGGVPRERAESASDILLCTMFRAAWEKGPLRWAIEEEIEKGGDVQDSVTELVPSGDGRDSLFSAAAEALRGINRWFEDDANLDDLDHARDVLAAALGKELLGSGFGDD